MSGAKNSHPRFFFVSPKFISINDLEIDTPEQVSQTQMSSKATVIRKEALRVGHIKA